MKLNDFKILIAEDEPSVRRIYEKAFALEGFEVVLADSGEQILAELAEGSFDLMITDMHLASMSALEVLPDVRKSHPKLPIIVVSGHYMNLEEDFHQKGFNVNMVFNKPLGLNTLKRAVRKLLGLPETDETKKNSIA